MEPTVTEQSKPTQVADDVVVSMDYTLTIDGTIVDSSEEAEPIMFVQGKQNIIRGLENALYGMKTGESKKVSVAPADAYGEHDPEAIMEVPRSEFPPEIPLKPGVTLEVTDTDGDSQPAQIVEVTKSTVRLDFNHPLAGKTLDFDVKVVDLRAATPEELDHGHVHDDDYDEDDEDFFDEEFDDDDIDDEDDFYDDDEDFDDEEFDDEDDYLDDEK
jgi:FKBP-type peptidyl-prolyl cis-trans isomerase SlyD